MRIGIDAGAFARDLRTACDREAKRVDKAVSEAIQEAGVGLKEEMRDQTFSKLGHKVAYAWQGRFYANREDPRGPAAFVWTKAPRIIDFFRAEKIVTPIGAAFAIPVNPVIKRGGRPMTPIEVEARFNQELQAVKLPSGNVGLFLDLVKARSGRGVRAPTRGRLAQGRKAEKTLMFVLVRSIRSRRIIDLVGPANRWAAKVPQLVEKRLGAAR